MLFAGHGRPELDNRRPVDEVLALAGLDRHDLLAFNPKQNHSLAAVGAPRGLLHRNPVLYGIRGCNGHGYFLVVTTAAIW